MRFCSMKHNVTLAMYEMSLDDIVLVKNNKLTGFLGDMFNKYLDLNKPNLCKLIGVSSFGEKLENGSYTKALALLKESKVDMYARPEMINIKEEFVDFTSTILNEKFSVGQIAINLSTDYNHHKAISLFNIDDSIKYLTYLTMILTLILLIFLVNEKTFVKKLELITRNLFEFNIRLSRSFNYIGFIIIFYNIFFNGIQVIVNTSILIDSIEDLNKTILPICWLKDEMEEKFARKSREGSYLNRLYNKQTYNTMTNDYNRCYYTKAPSVTMWNVMKTIVYFLTTPTMGAVFAYISNFRPNGEVFWRSEKSFYETISVYYFRKGCKLCKDEFEKITLIEFENALQKNLFDKMTKKLISTFEFRHKIYYRKDDIIKEFTKFTNINFKYFEYLFIYYLIVNFLILILQFLPVSLIYKLIRKKSGIIFRKYVAKNFIFKFIFR